jgi:hypothetical protein
MAGGSRQGRKLAGNGSCSDEGDGGHEDLLVKVPIEVL